MSAFAGKLRHVGWKTYDAMSRIEKKMYWAVREETTYLSDRHGIGVRDGKFCAHPLMQHLLGGNGSCADDDGSAVRASIGIGTTDEHVDRLVEALIELTTR